MKKLSLLIFLVLTASSVLMAQSTATPTGPYGSSGYTPTTAFTYANPTSPAGTKNGGSDILGAHNGYGRGCVMCHAPHSGAFGNGLSTSGDPQNSMYALWGEDLTPLYNRTFSFSGDGNTTSYPVTLPSNLVASPPAGVFNGISKNGHSWWGETIILFCLSCHDGLVTHVGMMQGKTVESLPIVGGNAPTLLALAAPSGGTPYSNDHPVGANAVVGCGAPYNWDCTVTITGSGATETSTSIYSSISSTTNLKAFLVNNPSSFWNTTSNPLTAFQAVPGNPNAVTCTTCHNQHSMTVYTNSNGSYATMFFIKGQYTPNANGNAVAQFCRNCHGGESNESNGVEGVPTI